MEFVLNPSLGLTVRRQDVVGGEGERLVHAHRRATHKSLELLKIGMELNNTAEEKRTMDARHQYIVEMNETLEQVTEILGLVMWLTESDQEREIVEYLRHELSEFYAKRKQQPKA